MEYAKEQRYSSTISIRRRIETFFGVPAHMKQVFIPAPFPLEEGLKPSLQYLGLPSSSYSSTISIRRRIETRYHPLKCLSTMLIPAPFPLEEGLKLCSSAPCKTQLAYSSTISIRRRIETFNTYFVKVVY